MGSVSRRWLLRGAVVLGAAASIATPQKKWTVDADIPSAASDATRGRTLTVSASREPELFLRRGETWERARPTAIPQAWPATVTFEVPSGTGIDRLLVEHGCGGGLCSGKCDVPEGEYVRIDRVAPTTWTLASPESSLSRSLGKPVPRAVVVVEASRAPTLEVTTPGMTYVPTIEPRGYADGRATFAVDFRGYRGGEITTVWSVRARIEGPCTGACPVPPGERVVITQVTDE